LRWAIEQAAQELQRGLPSLGSFKHGPAVKLIDRLRAMPLSDRLDYWIALIRCRLARQRFRVPALENEQDPSPTEENLAKEFVQGIPQRSSSELEREAEARDNAASFKISRSELKSLVRRKLELKDSWPEPVEDGPTWRYVLPVNGLRLITTFDVGSRSYQLTYSQSIAFDDKNYLKESVSVLNWLGISGQTSWTHIRSDEMESVAESAARLCQLIQEALPSLVASPPGSAT
jgi:hypothetical protein